MDSLTDPLVDIRSVSKAFAGKVALSQVSLQVRPGETVCLIGPSGSGKSTLLRCMNHLETVDSGSVIFDGSLVGYERRDGHLRVSGRRSLRESRRDIGMVFQHFNLFPHLSALANVTLAPRRVLGMSRAEANDAGRQLLERVGLGDKTDSYPAELSGGQAQRVAIARGLAMRPKLMLFDEPTSALDSELVGEVLQVVAELSSSGMTMVVVTHELAFAREVADRIVFMEAGRIVEEGQAEKVLGDPAHPRTRDFLARYL